MKQELLKWIYENKVGRPSVFGLGAVETVYMDDLIEMINELEEPQVTNEQAWNKIAESYPETAQNLRITLDHAVYGHETEPQKVKVPAYVAEWIERNKSGDVQLIIILKYFGQWYEMNENENLNDEICKWVIENSETFMRAWLDGYEVEEEPKYYLDLPKMGMVNEISNSQLCWTNCEGGITEKEIKAIDERYWPFAVPVEKVEV
ncbi:DUF1642 domain-containing protein [Enterococcus avium]|uniref:DUF1642 domain-containing protein n=1 Tax=Enterococcus avium TaxID=33945 RepID=UPI003D0E029C